MVKHSPAMKETWIWFPWVEKSPLENGKATHSSVLTWRIPMDKGAWWAAVHGVEVIYDWTTQHNMFTVIKIILFPPYILLFPKLVNLKYIWEAPNKYVALLDMQFNMIVIAKKQHTIIVYLLFHVFCISVIVSLIV